MPINIKTYLIASLIGLCGALWDHNVMAVIGWLGALMISVNVATVEIEKIKETKKPVR